ncbi:MULTISPECIES: efflux RND transporter permease subunit [unclassified Marichromatium]|uniref:efflux RND transporter permease subunit n=1 Tax=unclassified Marichromatium TaxID=2618417 RepID=UPI000F40C948|nr:MULTISPECIES: efflux RND transporter permease subunit [unclassified Marichromatium]RNE88943.1 efflux RND transporter permease subunit [Marichromatium sp. AB31]RNE91841.1 efflux RND transporter permease subunit [Marichromatium sp. AB32]
MARFFIDRPVFAWVIAIVIMLAGVLSILGLPVSQYPNIAPPAITITATYPGASARTLEDSVTQVIEQQMNGLDGLRYMSATSESTGIAAITLTFDNDIDPDIAQMQVQNKLQLALPMLPQRVQQQGIQVAKSVRNFLMVVAFVSRDGRLDRTDLGDFVASRIKDPISRVKGVGEVTAFGSQYAMRLWLDPNRLNQYGLTPADVAAAVRAENAQISAGELGAQPALPGQRITATINVQDRLSTPEAFGAIRLRTTSDGATVHLRDVARIELAGETYGKIAHHNGQPASGLGIRLATGANALETADAIRHKLDELAAFFPEGVEAVFPYDTTPFVRISIHEVIKTLLEAVLLVFVVMYLFLQNLRATLIPAIAVPVVLLGTFGVLAAFGYSINTLTLFAMVLAIGLLVDDAIVVVENVERVMHEEGLEPREATRRSMDQITSALIGIALVLSAVFVPMAFFGGSTGVIYRQFSVTIVSAMLLSVVVALTLSPALTATLLKRTDHAPDRGFFGWFNRNFERSVGGYTRSVGGIVRRRWVFLGLYLALVGVLAMLYMRMPTAFLPDEDQGILVVQVVLPSGASQERTLEVVREVEHYFLEDEQETVEQLITVAGFSFAGQGQNMAIGFVQLKDWELRSRPDQQVKALAGRAMQRFARVRDAQVFAFAPPPVIELGNATGWDLQLQDQGELGHEALMAARGQLLAMAAEHPALVGVRPNGRMDEAQYQIEVDRTKAGALGLSLADINDTLSSAWGSAYIDDFVHAGRVKKVYMQADAGFRMQPEDLDAWYVRNEHGEMVPFSAFAAGEWTYGSPRLERYNGLASAEVLGQAAPGVSSGEAMAVVESLVDKLPPGIGMEWTGISFEERAAGAQAPALYALSALVVFLALAALYESWSVPFAVMLAVPLGVLGAVLAATGRGLPSDIYFQVGLLATIGLAAKNAILIVEFARTLQEQGKSAIEAAIEAARMRIRPIVMTSLAFGFGVLPLALSSGAGSGSQHAIGTGVLGGVVASTLLGVLFVPLFFVLVRGRMNRRAAPRS